MSINIFCKVYKKAKDFFNNFYVKKGCLSSRNDVR